jgi:hypothetical protein
VTVDDERTRLVRHICEYIRLYAPTRRIDDYFRMRMRLQNTSLPVLRQIVEEDAVTMTARQCGVRV